MIIFSVVLTVVTLAIVVLLATQVELFRDMRQVREVTGLLDQSLPLDLG